MEALAFYFTAVIISAVVTLVFVAGILISPMAAVLSAVQARQNGQNMLLYGAIGGAYSLLLLLPWINLALRMSGQRVPVGIVISIYATVFTTLSIMTIAWYLLFSGAADWLLTAEASKRLMVYLGFI